MRIKGYKVEDGSLVVGWRRTARKAFDLADQYAPKVLIVTLCSLTVAEIVAIERMEQSRLRSPIALGATQVEAQVSP